MMEVAVGSRGVSGGVVMWSCNRGVAQKLRDPESNW